MKPEEWARQSAATFARMNEAIDKLVSVAGAAGIPATRELIQLVLNVVMLWGAGETERILRDLHYPYVAKALPPAEPPGE